MEEGTDMNVNSMFPSDNGIYRIRKCGLSLDGCSSEPLFRIEMARPDGIVVQAWLPAANVKELIKMLGDAIPDTCYLHEELVGECVSLHFDNSGRADRIGDPFGIADMAI